MTDTLKFARFYRACGFSVIPVRLDGSKAPALKWERFQSAPATCDDLARWFGGDRPLRGIAIVQGAVSGYAEVLECESEAAYSEFENRVRDHGRDDLLATLSLIVQSGGGGIHLYYRCPEGVGGNTKLAMEKNPSGVRPPYLSKIETRGEGGYVIAPGSPPCVHPTSNPYRLTSGSFRAVPVVSTADRDFLFAMARACNEYVAPEQYAPQAARRSTREPAGRSRPGDDYADNADPLPLLTGHGWTVARTRGDGAIELRRPGKKDGMSATLHAVAPGVFYCFSTSAAPFENNRAYDAWQVYAVLECGGDFHEAARELGMLGYGQQNDDRRQG